MNPIQESLKKNVDPVTMYSVPVISDFTKKQVRVSVKHTIKGTTDDLGYKNRSEVIWWALVAIVGVYMIYKFAPYIINNLF